MPEFTDIGITEGLPLSPIKSVLVICSPIKSVMRAREEGGDSKMEGAV